MTATLEQELEAMIAGSDYRVRLHGDSYLHVTICYLPIQRTSRDGRWLVEDGSIGHKLFGGSVPRRWKKARKFVRQTVEGHRRLLADGIRQQ